MEKLKGLVGGFINYKLMLTILLKQLEEHCKHPIEIYDIIYTHKETKLDFMVYVPETVSLPENYDPEKRNRLYKFNDPEFTSLAKRLLAEHTKGGLDMDFARILFRDKGDEITLEVYYTSDKGMKEKLTKIL